jgi:hypothetical protein
MTAMFRVRDAMGRERWQEQPIDKLVTRRDIPGPAFEDEIEEIRRRVR